MKTNVEFHEADPASWVKGIEMETIGLKYRNMEGMNNAFWKIGGINWTN